MAFTITTIQSVEADVAHASVVHGDETFFAMIPESLERLQLLSENFQAELGYDSVLKHERSSVKLDSESGIFATDDPAVVIIDGSIHHVEEIDSHHSLVDIYIQNGPEFLCVTSQELDNSIPELGSRVRLWVKGLKIYPTFT